MNDAEFESVVEDRSGQTLLDISNAVVRIHKQYYGKGPTKARAHLERDLLTVVLEGGLTRSEETLLEHGHAREVNASRSAMQESAEQALRNAVEEILGRKVRSLMSASDTNAGVSAEIFVFETPSRRRFDP